MSSPRPSSQALEEGGEPLLSIQYLRAVAALMVLVYHAMMLAPVDFGIGAAGVDLFFVISGFILWTIARERPVSPLEFLKRRWLRVAPLYWTLTLAVAAIAAAWPFVFGQFKPTSSHVLLSLAFVQHMNPDGIPFPLIPVGWSLNYEAIFYLIFAASLLAPSRRRLPVLLVLLIAVPAFGYFVYPAAFYMWANLFYLQFAAGVLLAEARMRGALPGRLNGAAMVAMGAATLALTYPFNVEDSSWRAIYWGAPMFLVVAGLVAVEHGGGLRRIGWLKLLGDASYSIYLAHFLAILLVDHPLHNGRWSFVLPAIAAGLAAGLACYWGLERPLLSILRRRPPGFLPSPAI